MKDEIIRYLPEKLQHILSGINDILWQQIEEIRIGVGKPIIICGSDFVYYINSKGKVCDVPIDCFLVSENDINCILELITGGSIYASCEKIKNGFITIPGGHRVGITGTGVVSNNNIDYIKDISGMNFRIRHEIIGVSKDIINHIIEGEKLRNTLIIGPPKSGKTTYLRDIARILGNHEHKIKISIVDERGEIAAMHNRIAQNSIGVFCDVLDFCPKSEGMMLMVRSMSPDVIITDEIGLKADIRAINEISKCGVKIITTIHGYDVCDIPEELKDFFELSIILSNRNGTGTIEKIIKNR